MLVIFALSVLVHTVCFGFGLYVHKKYESKFINCGGKYLLLMLSLLINFATIIYFLPRIYVYTDNAILEIIFLTIGVFQFYVLYVANLKLGAVDANKNL